MNLISVNVDLPREVTWKGKTVTTGIFKQPIAGRVALRRLGLEGLSVMDILRLYVGDRADPELLERAAQLEMLPQEWRARLRKRMGSTRKA